MTVQDFEDDERIAADADEALDVFYNEWQERPFTDDGVDRDRVFDWLNWNERLLWYGDTGEGKSLLSVIAMIDVLDKVGEDSVRYIDLENGRARTDGRLDSILATRSTGIARPEDVKAFRVFYTDNFTRFGPRFNFAAIANEPELMDEWKRLHGLVIIDSLTKALDQLDLDEDSNRDVTRFVRTFVDPLIAKPRTSVLVLDNVGHEGNRPRGAKAKMQLFDRLERVTGGKTCTPDTQGKIKLMCTRSRDGDIGRIITVRIGGGVYDSLASGGEQDARLAAVLTILEGEVEPLSGNELEQRLRDANVSPGRRGTLHQDLKRWAEDGAIRAVSGGYKRRTDDE